MFFKISIWARFFFLLSLISCKPVKNQSSTTSRNNASNLALSQSDDKKEDEDITGVASQKNEIKKKVGRSVIKEIDKEVDQTKILGEENLNDKTISNEVDSDSDGVSDLEDCQSSNDALSRWDSCGECAKLGEEDGCANSSYDQNEIEIRSQEEIEFSKSVDIYTYNVTENVWYKVFANRNSENISFNFVSQDRNSLDDENEYSSFDFYSENMSGPLSFSKGKIATSINISELCDIENANCALSFDINSNNDESNQEISITSKENKGSIFTLSSLLGNSPDTLTGYDVFTIETRSDETFYQLCADFEDKTLSFSTDSKNCYFKVVRSSNRIATVAEEDAEEQNNDSNSFGLTEATTEEATEETMTEPVVTEEATTEEDAEEQNNDSNSFGLTEATTEEVAEETTTEPVLAEEAAIEEAAEEQNNDSNSFGLTEATTEEVAEETTTEPVVTEEAAEETTTEPVVTEEAAEEAAEEQNNDSNSFGLTEDAAEEATEETITEPVLAEEAATEEAAEETITEPVLAEEAATEEAAEETITEPVLAEEAAEETITEPVVTEEVAEETITEPVLAEETITEPVVTEEVAEETITEPVVTEETATEEAATEEAATEEAATEETTTEPVVTEEAATEEAATEETTTEPVVTEEAATEEAATEETTTEPVVTEEAATEETTTEPVVTEEAATEEATTEETITEPVVTEETITEPVVTEEAAVAETTEECGNSIKEGNETCDDGNTETETTCAYGSATCTACKADCSEILSLAGYCGDGTKDANETCDDGNTETEEACTYGSATCNACASDCSKSLNLTGSYCGDSVKNENETCDDGNTETEITCAYGSATCTACKADCSEILSLAGPHCGDGTTDTNETCDGQAWCQSNCSISTDANCCESGYKIGSVDSLTTIRKASGQPDPNTTLRCADNKLVATSSYTELNKFGLRCYGLDSASNAISTTYNELWTSATSNLPNTSYTCPSGYKVVTGFKVTFDEEKLFSYNIRCSKQSDVSSSISNSSKSKLGSLGSSSGGDFTTIGTSTTYTDHCPNGYVITGFKYYMSDSKIRSMNFICEKYENKTCDSSSDNHCSVCGDGSLGGKEICDDGNTATETACQYGNANCISCSEDCLTSFSLTGSYCGDGTKDTNEICDDGNTTTETACAYGSATCTSCKADCSESLSLAGPHCGDGTTDTNETCDGQAWCQSNCSISTDSNCCESGYKIGSVDSLTTIRKASGQPDPNKTLRCPDNSAVYSYLSISQRKVSLPCYTVSNTSGNFSTSSAGSLSMTATSNLADTKYTCPSTSPFITGLAVTFDTEKVTSYQIRCSQQSHLSSSVSYSSTSNPGTKSSNTSIEYGTVPAVGSTTTYTDYCPNGYVITGFKYYMSDSKIRSMNFICEKYENKTCDSSSDNHCSVCGDGSLGGKEICDDGNTVTECESENMNCTSCSTDCLTGFSL